MKFNLLRLFGVLVLLGACATQVPPAHGIGVVHVDAMRGGQKVVTAGFQSSTYVMRSYPGATLRVYEVETDTLATIYSDTSLTVIVGSTLTADSSGYAKFFTNEAQVDIEFSGAGIPTHRRTYVTVPELTGGYLTTLDGDARYLKLAADNDPLTGKLTVAATGIDATGDLIILDDPVRAAELDVTTELTVSGFGTFEEWVTIEGSSASPSLNITSGLNQRALLATAGDAATTNATVVVKEHSSGQAANTKLQEWQNELGNVVASLDVEGDVIANIITAGSGTAGAPSFTFSGDTDTGIYQTTNNLFFATAGAERFQIASDGRMAINGDPTNVAMLHIVGDNVVGSNLDLIPTGLNVGATVEVMSSDYSSTFKSAYLQYCGSSCFGDYITGVPTADTGALIFQGPAQALIATTNASDLIFGTDFTERMRIDATGDVSIENDLTAATLDVSGAGGDGVTAVMTGFFARGGVFSTDEDGASAIEVATSSTSYAATVNNSSLGVCTSANCRGLFAGSALGISAFFSGGTGSTQPTVVFAETDTVGQATGTKLTEWRDESGTAVGSVDVDGNVVFAGYQTTHSQEIPDGAATAFVTLSIPDVAGQGVTSGVVEWTVEVLESGGETQALTGSHYFAASRGLSGTNCTVGAIGTAILAQSDIGTLTNALTCTAVGSTLTLLADAESSYLASAPTHFIKYQVRVNGSGVTVTPQ